MPDSVPASPLEKPQHPLRFFVFYCHPGLVLFDYLVVDAFGVSTSAQPCQNASILSRHSPFMLFSTYVVMIREWGRDRHLVLR